MNQELQKKGKKIVLLLNDCSVHLHIQALMVILPANTTTVFQLMDQEVREAWNAATDMHAVFWYPIWWFYDAHWYVEDCPESKEHVY